MMKHILITAATALLLTLAPMGDSTDQAFARNGNWHGGGGHWQGGGGNWHGGGWHGGGWHGGGWHGGGWRGGGWRGGDWGWGGGWGWGAPAFGLGLGYGAWGFGAGQVCEPVFRPVRVRTNRGWRWRDVYVGDRCYWVNRW